MYRVAICDDQPQDAQRLRDMLQRFSPMSPGISLHADIYHDSQALLQTAAQRPYDLYFIDILMPGLNGLETARCLRQYQMRPVIIFLSSSPDFSLEAYRVRALNYLIKPITQEELNNALYEVVSLFLAAPPRYQVILTADGLVSIHTYHLSYVECFRHTILYHLGDGNTLTSRNMRVSFAKLTRTLLEKDGFLQPHRSYVVNPVHIAKMTAQEFFLLDESRIPISKLRLSEVKEQYLNYLSEHSFSALG